MPEPENGYAVVSDLEAALLAIIISLNSVEREAFAVPINDKLTEIRNGREVPQEPCTPASSGWFRNSFWKQSTCRSPSGEVVGSGFMKHPQISIFKPLMFVDHDRGIVSLARAPSSACATDVLDGTLRRHAGREVYGFDSP